MRLRDCASVNLLNTVPLPGLSDVNTRSHLTDQTESEIMRFEVSFMPIKIGAAQVNNPAKFYVCRYSSWVDKV